MINEEFKVMEAVGDDEIALAMLEVVEQVEMKSNARTSMAVSLLATLADGLVEVNVEFHEVIKDRVLNSTVKDEGALIMQKAIGFLQYAYDQHIAGRCVCGRPECCRKPDSVAAH